MLFYLLITWYFYEYKGSNDAGNALKFSWLHF